MIKEEDLPAIPQFVADKFEKMEWYEKDEFTTIRHVLQYAYSTEHTDMEDNIHQWITENPEEYVEFAKYYNIGLGYRIKD